MKQYEIGFCMWERPATIVVGPFATQQEAIDETRKRNRFLTGFPAWQWRERGQIPREENCEVFVFSQDFA